MKIFKQIVLFGALLIVIQSLRSMLIPHVVISKWRTYFNKIYVFWIHTHHIRNCPSDGKDYCITPPEDVDIHMYTLIKALKLTFHYAFENGHVSALSTSFFVSSLSLSLFRTNFIDLEKLRFCSSGKLVQYLTLNCTMARKVVTAVAWKKTAEQVEPLFIPFDQWKCAINMRVL